VRPEPGDESATGGLGDWAVDMTLVLRTSVDNAGALPQARSPHNNKKACSHKDFRRETGPDGPTHRDFAHNARRYWTKSFFSCAVS